MAYTVEDGTIVEGANGYETLENIRAYALDRGVALSADDAVLTPLAIKATDFIELRRNQFVGKQTSVDQALSFPRTGMKKPDESLFPDNVIPDAIKQAQAQLCIEQFNNINILPTYDPEQKFITRERIDVIETYYSERLGTSPVPFMPVVEGLLATVIPVASFSGLRTVRI